MHKKLDGAMHHRESCRDDRDESEQQCCLRRSGRVDLKIRRALEQP
jgi:hypothetical protein